MQIFFQKLRFADIET